VAGGRGVGGCAGGKSLEGRWRRRSRGFFTFSVLPTSILLETQYKRVIIYINTHTHLISMSTFERSSQFNIKIHKVDHQERLTVNGYITSHYKNN
jgi:uncharacterized membrane protein